MKKLNDIYLKEITSGNDYSNELVVLPADGDVGFDECFDFRANQIII